MFCLRNRMLSALFTKQELNYESYALILKSYAVFWVFEFENTVPNSEKGGGKRRLVSEFSE